MNGDALRYHEAGRPGKLAIRPTKPLANQRDLSLAYTPGVAEASRAVAERPEDAARYTARSNLVAVVTNGSAVLGLGNIGALAAKPVMEGKAVLFKKFADIDVFDIEIDESDPDALADTIRRLEPTFGAINLEDIKAPDCFLVEDRLKAEMNIPVFHDDQHGTAIVVAAAVVNGMYLLGKDLGRVKLVSTGGGAAGIACLNMLLDVGLKRENVWLVDMDGLVRRARAAEPHKAAFAQDSDARTLDDVIGGAEIFLGLSGPDVLSAEQVRRMGPDPMVMALANPVPEIMPEEVRAVRPDAVVLTGRSDYPNQVNNVLCFPFIFRGALDVGATGIDRNMELASVRALAELARAGITDEVARAYGERRLQFGRDYLLPRPFDPRLLGAIAPAVAEAAMESGIASRPLADIEAYRARLSSFVYRTGFLMRPVFDSARAAPRRVIFAEGEDDRVLRAIQNVLDEGVAVPVATGRPDRIAARCAELGLRVAPGRDFEVFDHGREETVEEYGARLHRLRARDGVGPDDARKLFRSSDTLASAMYVREGGAASAICGTDGHFPTHLERIRRVLGTGAETVSTLVPLIMDAGTVFIADGYVNYEPSAEEVAGICRMAAAQVRAFGLTPRVALVSHTNFGAHSSPSAERMRRATGILTETEADFEFEGEMQLNLAFDKAARDRFLPDARLTDRANILVFPGMDAANAAINALTALGNAQPIGPLLLGYDGAAHIVTPAVTVRGLLNVAAIASAGRV
ncbi:MAG: NADP-dependent malic enzyme [Alphaproteobacteria bacterium]|nr:NADP-dependent malic enzyme [Alphaproteobacteria bacterium]